MEKVKKINVLMIVENYYPQDTRVYKEVQTLKERYKISIIALKRRGEKVSENLDTIQIFRIPEIPRYKITSNRLISRYLEQLLYIFQYSFFTICSIFIFLVTFIYKKYKILHVHNPPDTLFLIGIIGRLFSVKFIFDHHDLSPELYLTRFSDRKDIFHKILILMEKYSCRVADIIISTNRNYKKLVVERHGIDANKIFVVRNDPIIDEFRCNNDMYKKENKHVLLYLGSINPQDGLDILMQALHYIVYSLGRTDFVCYVIGDGDSLETVRQIGRKLKIIDFILFQGYITDRNKIREYLNMSDICLEPAPDNQLNRYSTFIKIMEYMAASKPIVAFDLEETRYSTNGSALLIEPGDTEEYAKAIAGLMDNPELRQELGRNGYERIINELNWENASFALIEAYNSVTQPEI